MRIAIVSTYPPRQCGIATFSYDLCESLRRVEGIERVDVIAVTPDDESYPRPVIATIRRDVRADYGRAARLLARIGVDVVVVQHEFGIFGGRDGSDLLALTNELTIPYVVTLHTVVREPTASQAAVLGELCDGAAGVVVFTETARRLLTSSGTVGASRAHVVPHGAPDRVCAVATRDRAEVTTLATGAGTALDVRGRFVVSSFGLLSPGKGLEIVIEALAEVVPAHPEVLLVVAGRTHPEVARRHGESYRALLLERVQKLGLGRHVAFDDRFVSVEELADLLAVTDVFVTAYPSPDQIASGSLTFAIAAGCPVVSTPYLYAIELLRSGCGRLVPFDDPASLATTLGGLIEDPEALDRHRDAARRVGSGLSWRTVAATTSRVLVAATRPAATAGVGEPVGARA